jgi:hypothetical protein
LEQFREAVNLVQDDELVFMILQEEHGIAEFVPFGALFQVHVERWSGLGPGKRKGRLPTCRGPIRATAACLAKDCSTLRNATRFMNILAY